MQALLEAGADKSAGAMDDMSALHFAAQQGHTEVVKALIIAGVSIVQRSTPCPLSSPHRISTLPPE